MVDHLTIEHIGIIAVIIGTVLLAFSLKVKRMYQEDAANVVDELKKHPHLVEPTETYICPWLFWTGLLFVAIGSLLQW